MDAPLQKLRDLFNFGRSGDDHSEHQYLLDLLDGLAGKPPHLVISALHTQYLPAVACQRNLHMRFKLLENSRAEAIRCLPVLESKVSEAVLPLPAEASDSALIADNFLKSLASAYIGIVSGITTHHQEAALAHLMQHAIRRAMRALLRRQVLAYRAYAPPSASSWQQMHDLYRNARNRNLHGGHDDKSIERVYLTALLLAYADPNKIPRNELDELKMLVENLAPLAAIGDAAQFERGQSTLSARFLVDVEEGAPGRPLAKVPETASLFGNYIVECRGVVSAIDRRLMRYANQEHDEHEPQHEKLLTSLRTSLGGQIQRRFSRIRFKPKADLVAGFDNAVQFIANGTLIRRESDFSSKPPLATSEWALINESPDGFGIRFQKGEKWPMQAGDLVVLRTREGSRIHVCLVRRIANLDQHKLELGLQELSPEAGVLKLEDGQTAICLPRLPAFQGSPGLILPAQYAVSSDLSVAIALNGSAHRWKPGKHAESNGRIQFHVLEPIT
ncbi:MAG: hypothetical protein J0M19_09195 [Sphingomonadales bacterium]|nr:hypothetical protein [Sphingomonadales bacterium]